MSYTYDADLEFLGECTDEQLRNLAEVLIYDFYYIFNCYYIFICYK